MITIKDMSGLIPPKRVSDLIKLFKKNLSIPIDFHTHCTPGYGLASVVAAIEAGVDVVDTNIWNFAGGPAAPAIELIYIFCKKMGVELDINMEAVAKINKELYTIRKELDAVDAVKIFPNDTVGFLVGIGDVAGNLIVHLGRVRAKRKRHNVLVAVLPFHGIKVNAPAVDTTGSTGLEPPHSQSQFL